MPNNEDSKRTANVLFVDDDPGVLRGLARALSDNHHWNVIFAPSASEAWDVLGSVAVDVIVSDMRMADVDGAELLSAVRRVAPSTLRIVLSGYRDEGAAVRSAIVAHQFFAKPLSGAALTERVDTLLSLNSVNSALDTAAITSLASPTAVIERLWSVLEGSPSIEDVVEVVGVDPALALKVLQLGNSAFFGNHGELSDLAACVRKIGMDALRDLASMTEFATVVETLPPQNADAVMKVWEHATRSHAVEGSLASLLHGIGVHAGAQVGLVSADDVRGPRPCSSPLIDHGAGERLMRLWGVPEGLIAESRTAAESCVDV